LAPRFLDESLLEDWKKLGLCLEAAFDPSHTTSTHNALYTASSAELALLGELVASEYTEGDSVTDGIMSIFLSLAEKDADSCCALLEVLGDIIVYAAPRALELRKLELVSCLHKLVLQFTDQEVKCKAQWVLGDVLMKRMHLKERFLSSVETETLVAALNGLQQQCLHGSPSVVQSALKLHGCFLDYALTSPPSREACRQELFTYIVILRESIEDTNVSLT
jgi:hypothetical protein